MNTQQRTFGAGILKSIDERLTAGSTDAEQVHIECTDLIQKLSSLLEDANASETVLLNELIDKLTQAIELADTLDVIDNGPSPTTTIKRVEPRYVQIDYHLYQQAHGGFAPTQKQRNHWLFISDAGEHRFNYVGVFQSAVAAAKRHFGPLGIRLAYLQPSSLSSNIE